MNKHHRRITALLLTAFSLAQVGGLASAGVAMAETAALPISGTFSEQYTALTKKILLSSVELERFSLNYRREAGRIPKFRPLRYLLAQEAGASCLLAFEITGDQQFGVGRNHPLRLRPSALNTATTTAVVGSIIGASSSAFELSSNLAHAIKNARRAYDPRSANHFISIKLKQIDTLLAQRQALVQAHASDPAYSRAVVEGKILNSLHNAFIDEYSQFHADTRTYAALQNTFFALNAGYNTVGAIAAGLANRGLSVPAANGAANILFTVSGGMATVTPVITTAAGWVTRRLALSAAHKAAGSFDKFDPALLTAQRKELEELTAHGTEGTLIPSLTATERLALYTDSQHLFSLQLANEARIMHVASQVALQSTMVGPEIGGLLLTQGILGTNASFADHARPRKQLNQLYRGTVCGTVGTGALVVGNAAFLLASIAYENHLRKKHELPDQLIEDRLKHIDEIEKTLSAL